MHPLFCQYIAQMDESKSLAFRAMEELLKAQSTQSQLKRQFVMAELRESITVKREQTLKQEVCIGCYLYLHLFCLLTERGQGKI